MSDWIVILFWRGGLEYFPITLLPVLTDMLLGVDHSPVNYLNSHLCVIGLIKTERRGRKSPSDQVFVPPPSEMQTDHTLSYYSQPFTQLNILYKAWHISKSVWMLKAAWASETTYPAPLRIQDWPILIQYTVDHICALLMCAKEACILLNQLT